MSQIYSRCRATQDIAVCCNFSLFWNDVLCHSQGEFHCSFEEEPICMFTQDKNDDFDWTRHSAATRDTKYTPNTGPSGDHSGSKQGKELKRPPLTCPSSD